MPEDRTIHSPVWHCNQVSTDHIQFHFDPDKALPEQLWLETWTKYPNCRITICLSDEDQAAMSAWLGALPKS